MDAIKRDTNHCASNQDCQQAGTYPVLPHRDITLERILFYADVSWLGMDDALSPAIHRRQVLAAQLYYLDNAPIDEIIELLPPHAGDAWLTHSTVNSWLRHEGVIRALAYHELYFTNNRLAGHRFSHAEPVQAVDRVDNLIARMAPVFGAEQVIRMLAAPGLWKRLAFQYHYLEHLAGQDICRRLQTAAQRTGYEVTDHRLNVWLRGQRLLLQLARAIAGDATP